MTDLHPLGIAVWGLGNHAWKNVLPAIATSSSVKLIGFHTRNLDNAKQASQKFGGKVFTTPEAMLNDETIDAIYLVTPTGLHFEHGMMVLAANKHLLCEKSLTHCGKKSLQLIEHARAKNLVLLEAFMYLYHTQFLQALDLILRPDFGKILTIISNFGIPELPSTSFRTSKELGGGALLDVGCYTVSAVLAILQSFPKMLQFEKKTDQKYGIDVSGVATLEFPSGAKAFLDWGYNRAYTADLAIWGENQTLYINRAFSKPANYESKILLSDKHGYVTQILVQPENSFNKMFSFFKQAIFSQEKREKYLEFSIQQAKTMDLFQQT